MSKAKFEVGSSQIRNYFAWINERHSIYMRRTRGDPKPWTKDEVLLDYKFTNVFRQLDTGTLWLRKMIDPFAWDDDENSTLMVWNVVWYRLFNWWKHAAYMIKHHGMCPSMDILRKYIMKLVDRGEKIFTGVHITHGVFGELKYDTFLNYAEEAWRQRTMLMPILRNAQTLREVLIELDRLPGIGEFLAYEIVCDLRFTFLLFKAKDILTWGNVGAGAKRGLLRLGLEPSVDSMVKLFKIAPNYLGQHILEAKTKFEVREIEHCLCEFDKYERIRLKQGQIKGKYDGRSS